MLGRWGAGLGESTFQKEPMPPSPRTFVSGCGSGELEVDEMGPWDSLFLTPRLAELAALYARRGEEVLFASLLAPRARANELVAYIVGCALAVGSSPIDRPWLAGRSPNGRVYARPVFELAARLGARRAKGGSAASLTSLTIGGVAITVEKGRELLEVELARTQ